ncbi:restriction endonuclease subunit S [Phaeobacter sp. Ax4a-4a]|uniref:restriction endonuclease subunit S n=1 Tax=Phaeobacter sp. Ax4a-4a TaxID=3112437 RepID=UPI003A8B5378
MVPEGWKQVRLDRHAKHVTSGSRGWAEFYSDTGDVFVRITNLRRRSIAPDWSNTKHVKLPGGIREGTRTRLQRGDILISITADLGVIGYIHDEPIVPHYINQHVALVRLDQREIEPEFVAYSLSSSEMNNIIQRLNDAGAKAGLSLPTIRSIPVKLPPLPEQRKIADILSTWDRAIETTEALLATARTQKRALMQSLLTGKRRFPEFEGQEWKEVRIGDIAKEVAKRNKAKASYTVISCSKTIGFVNSLDYFKKQVFSDDLTGYKVIRRNQIGYPSNHVEEGSIGIQNLYDAALVSPIYTVFEPGRDVDPMFLFRVLKTERYRQIFAAATNASVDRRGSLRWKAFSTIKVRLPRLDEQRRINEVLAAADQEIADLEAQIKKLHTEKKALMQQLLTGKRRVKVGVEHGV